MSCLLGTYTPPPSLNPTVGQMNKSTISSTQTLTIACWFRPNVVTEGYSGSNLCGASMGSDSTSPGIKHNRTTDAIQLSWALNTSADVDSTVKYATYGTTQLVSEPNRWNLIVMTIEVGFVMGGTASGCRTKAWLNGGAVETQPDWNSSIDGVRLAMDNFYHGRGIGGAQFRGAIGCLWVSTELVDLTDSNIRAKFLNVDGTPPDYGYRGEKITGNIPLIYTTGGADRMTQLRNLGSAGDFTGLNLAFTDSPFVPVKLP